MAITQIPGKQIKDSSIQRSDIDTGTSGSALITKVIAGTNITISQTGADDGTGDVTLNVPTASSGVAGVVSNTTQTLSGIKNFDNNVGLNTTSPGTTGTGAIVTSGAIVLDVVGSSSQDAFIRVMGGSGSTKGGLVIGNNDSGKDYGQFTFDNGTNAFKITQNYTSGYLGLGANGRSTDFQIAASGGDVTINTLAGTGTRMVVTNSTGVLSSQTIPSSATAISRSINTISGNTTAGSTAYTDYVYYISNGSTLTLPTAIGNTNRYTVMRTGSSTAPIATTSSQTINGQASPLNLTVQYASVDLLSDGTNWYIH